METGRRIQVECDESGEKKGVQRSPSPQPSPQEREKHSPHFGDADATSGREEGSRGGDDTSSARTLKRRAMAVPSPRGRGSGGHNGGMTLPAGLSITVPCTRRNLESKV